MAGIRKLSALSVGALALVLGGLPAAAAPGDLDPSYGTDGKVVIDLPGVEETEVTDTAIDAAGRLVMTGIDLGAGLGFVARFSTDGALDTSFSTDGVELAPAGVSSLAAVAIQPDGKIVAVGGRINPTPGIFVTRLNDDGTPDATFGTGGSVDLVNGMNTTNEIVDVAVQPSGRLTMAGIRAVLADVDILVVNLTADGDLDLGFGGGSGVSVLEVEPIGTETVAAVAVAGGDATGASSIFVAGHTTGGDGDIFYAKLSPTGAFDTTFGDGAGYELVDVGTGDRAVDMLLDRSGNGVIAGNLNSNVVVARVTADGDLDPTFSADGTATIDLGGAAGDSDTAEGIALQADGRIVVGAGSLDTAGDMFINFAAARLLPNGSADGSFGTDGVMIVPIGEVVDSPEDVTIDGAGRILLAGTSNREAGGTDTAVVRLTGQTTRCGGELVTVDLALGYRPTKGADVVRGTGQADVINARGGADIVCGRGGADQLRGRGGADRLLGGRGADNLRGGGGNDVLNGGRGNDTCNGGGGQNELISC